MFGESSDDASAAQPPCRRRPMRRGGGGVRRRRGENAVLLQQQLEGFPLRMSGIDNSYKIDGDVLLVIHASIPPGVHRPTTDRPSDGRRRHRRASQSSAAHSYDLTSFSSSCSRFWNGFRWTQCNCVKFMFCEQAIIFLKKMSHLFRLLSKRQNEFEIILTTSKLK